MHIATKYRQLNLGFKLIQGRLALSLTGGGRGSSDPHSFTTLSRKVLGLNQNGTRPTRSPQITSGKQKAERKSANLYSSFDREKY